MLTVTLPQETETRLKALAEETSETISEHVQNAMAQYFLDLEEDRRDLALAETALEEVEREGTITLEELEQELGLQGQQ